MRTSHSPAHQPNYPLTHLRTNWSTNLPKQPPIYLLIHHRTKQLPTRYSFTHPSHNHSPTNATTHPPNSTQTHLPTHLPIYLNNHLATYSHISYPLSTQIPAYPPTYPLNQSSTTQPVSDLPTHPPTLSATTHLPNPITIKPPTHQWARNKHKNTKQRTLPFQSRE